jgi:hypothetical protein
MKTIMYEHATALTTNPIQPFIQNGPGMMLLRLVMRWGRMAAVYEDVDMMTKTPTKALNAVTEPT